MASGNGRPTLGEVSRKLDDVVATVKIIAIDVATLKGLSDRMHEMEDNWKWLFRTVVAAIILGAIGMIFFAAQHK